RASLPRSRDFPFVEVEVPAAKPVSRVCPSASEGAPYGQVDEAQDSDRGGPLAASSFGTGSRHHWPGDLHKTRRIGRDGRLKTRRFPKRASVVMRNESDRQCCGYSTIRQYREIPASRRVWSGLPG